MPCLETIQLLERKVKRLERERDDGIRAAFKTGYAQGAIDYSDDDPEPKLLATQVEHNWGLYVSKVKLGGL